MENGIPPQNSPGPDDFGNQPPPTFQSPPLPPPGYGYGQPQVFAEESQAVLAICMSAIGILACGGVLCPIGWYLGKKELEGIAAGRRDPSKKDLANAAKIIGIIGSVILIGTILFFGLFLLIPLIAILFGAAAEANALVS